MNDSFHLPKGFRAAGVYCGIKRDSDKRDISLIVCDRPATAAGVYTQNLVCAAPVILDRERTPSAAIRAVVTNSGNANACTGEQGMSDALRMAQITAESCGYDQTDVLVMSTGIIGEALDMAKVESGIRAAAAQLAADADALSAAAAGILTTDLVEKVAKRQFQMDGHTITITGIAKGSGMIAPNMATMLAVVMTDAHLAPATAQALLAATTAKTFNCISVDGHTSTNDTLLLLASGAAQPQSISDEQMPQFAAELELVCGQLARAIIDDGEGATHVLEIHVTGGASDEQAMTFARVIGSSPLVKTAVAGADPNWGRIVSAAGYAGPDFDPLGVSLTLNGTLLYRGGRPAEFDTAEVSRSMRENRKILIELQLTEGSADARFWTCDLTADYVRINADYHT